ncbi:hypothetical protein J3R30DRAFT_3288069 [Lentinula aciculospora]|uniref:Histone chaperone RTT106/FACT complex subunit SPT16-like middle domain-containing protein n=1 Tax=Lentinula aciculospora TaxID=153920 RepID=A0A9W9AG80_9AGAR|nr:hypothetical protein J3R30DRAFT_3288069 [Lentinula aciculospora]
MESSSQSPFRFLHVVSAYLPERMSKDLAVLCSSASTEALLDNLIRFVSGADCSSLSNEEGPQWASNQALVRQKLSELLSPSSTLSRKRLRDEHDLSDSSEFTKKQKLASSSSAPDGVDIDYPRFALKSISVTSPIRKKVDITIHQSTVRFVNSSTGTLEASVPLDSLRRAFLLPTRGKPKPHWTVAILSNDTGPEKNGKNKNIGGGDSKFEQVIFGLDATATSAITTTTFVTADSAESTSLKKGDETLIVLTEFLSELSRACKSLPNPNHISIHHLTIEKIDNFRGFTGSSSSSSTTGITLSPSLAISANLAAKSGTLWFMPSGILWSESKPCMFWSVEDFAKEEDVEGVRTISATGRVCTVVLTRNLLRDDDEGGDESIQLEETGFGQIEGKEQEVINQWVRKYRYLFGTGSCDDGGRGEGVTQAQAQAGPLTINQMIVDSDDEGDDDFNPENDGGSGSGSESGSGDEDQEYEEQEGEGEDVDADADAEGESEDEEDEEGELDPAHHPLLRPGAMPKMSRAAVDVVAGMVEQDLLGGQGEEDELDD